MALTNTVSSVTTIIRGLIGDNIKTDGRDSFVYSSDSTKRLTYDYVSSSTIVVTVNGVATTGFTYSSDTGYVTITDSLSANDTVIITYSYYEEYSDAEIEGFLNSALAYFPQYNYLKTFWIDSNDNILALNDTKPSMNELYFIAIIASILINPQNVKISIPDLTIDAKRVKSDVEQIKDAFVRFQSYLGDISAELREDLL
jgi:hypothetical protein